MLPGSVRRQRIRIDGSSAAARRLLPSKSDIKKNYTIGDQLVSGNFAVVRKGPKTPNTEKRAPTRVCGGAGQARNVCAPCATHALASLHIRLLGG